MCERTLGDKKRITSPYAALAKRGQSPNRLPRWPNPLRQEASAKKVQRAKKGEHANRVSSGSSRANTMLVAPRWGKRAFIGVATNCVVLAIAELANASANANANKMSISVECECERERERECETEREGKVDLHVQTQGRSGFALWDGVTPRTSLESRRMGACLNLLLSVQRSPIVPHVPPPPCAGLKRSGTAQQVYACRA